MNISKLFLRAPPPGEALVHMHGASLRITRTAPELQANVAHLCDALSNLGIRPGHSVLIVSGSRVEAVESLLAVFNLGATAMPVSALIGTENILEIVTATQPSCCFFEDPPDPKVEQALRANACVMVSFKSWNASSSERCYAYADLVAERGASLNFPDFPHEQRALVIHGSGSSGRLKAVSMSQGEMLRFCEYNEWVWSQYAEEPDALLGTSPIVTGLPLSHLAGLGTVLLGLMSGRRAYMMSFFVPDVYLKLVEEARCATIMLVPSLYRSVLSDPALGRMDRSALRFCLTGGEPCSADLIERIEAAFGIPLITVYSMTECLSGIGHSRHDLYARRIQPGCCGKQLFGELQLRDGTGQEHPSFGELWIRNATVHPCYLDPAANLERLHNGWFRTGDLFHRDADGGFFHRGRVDDMFICNGKNIYPLELELVLLKHPAVELACAVPVSNERKGLIPGALIVLRAAASEAEIQEFSLKHGPSHAMPQVVQFVEALPHLGAGKIDRNRVRQLLQQSHDARARSVA